MHSILREYIQGAVGWLAVVTAFIGAIATLLNAIWPFVKARRARRAEKALEKGGLTETQTQKETREIKISIKWKTGAVGLVLLFIAVGALQYVIKPPLISMSEERTNAAWDYFKKGEPNPIVERPREDGNLNHAIQIANYVIEDLRGNATTKQQNLLQGGFPPPPTGEVSAEQRRTIFAYGPLNDVATCLWIKGRAYQYLGKTNDAVLAYLQLTNYPYARTWDVKGWFWSPSEDALGRLSALTNGVP